MAVIPVEEYDASYFNGNSQSYTHNGGYSDYSRFNLNTKGLFTDLGVPLEESTGFFADMIKAVNFKASGVLVGKTCLVLGCAYGFEVQSLRDMGVDATGVDVSPYAISQATPEVAPYLSVADARSYLPSLARNSYDYIFSRGFLECLADIELISIITEMNRVCKRGQMHMLSFPNPAYYNVKTMAEWAALPFSSTILIERQDISNAIIV